MPERDRIIVFSFGLLILILVLTGLWHVASYNQNQSQQREAAATYEIAERESISECGELSTGFDKAVCLIQNMQASEEQERARHDLHAQHDMATWAVALLWVGIVGLVTSAAGIALIYATLHETRNMTAATREIGENVSKAYVNVNRAEIREIEVNKLIKITEIDTYLKNTGQTPAMDVVIGGQLVVYEKYFTVLGSEREICRVDVPYDRIVDLPPASEPQRVSFNLPKDIQDSVAEQGFNAFASIYLRFEGEVRYWDVFKTRYLTQFIFESLITQGAAYPGMFRSSKPAECYKKIDSKK